MKSLVNGLSTSVIRWPWAVVALTLAASLVFGWLSQGFTPQEDNNESFAPDAPELAAAERISDLFGEETSTTVMQVIVTAEEGGVFSLDGLAAAEAVSEAIETGALADRLVQQGPNPVFTFLGPVQTAVNQGGQRPGSDEELRSLFLQELTAMPPGPAGFVEGALPAGADPYAPSSDKGLVIAFLRAADPNSDEYSRFVEVSAEAADQIRAAPLPAGFTAEPFSFELLFSNNDEFQSEIGRLFGTAGLIIALVLALVFLIRPKRRSGRAVMWTGILAAAAAIVAVTLPTLALVLDSIFPDALKEWNSSALFPLAGTVLLALFLVWTFIDRGLRRTTADTVLTLITILFSITWMNGVGYLLFEDMSPMAQILPILLIGLGVDYSIHVTSRYREEISGGAGVDDSVRRAIRTVGVALVLATITTAVGFLTNLANDIPALREFGVLAAVGIGASFLLMVTFIPAMRTILDRGGGDLFLKLPYLRVLRVIPAMRTILDRRGKRRGMIEPGRLGAGDSRALGLIIGKTSVIAKRAAAGAAVLAVVLGGLGVWGWSQLDTKFSFLDFIPVTSPLRTTFEALIDDFGGGFGENTQVLIEGDVATAEAWNAMVSSNREAADTPDVLAPGGQPSGTSPVSVIDELAAPGAPGFSPEVQQALQAAGADPSTLLVPPGADIAPLYDAAWEANPGLTGQVLHRSGGGYDAALFDYTTQAGETNAGRLRLDLLDDFGPAADAGLSVTATSEEIIQDVVVTTLRNSQVSSLFLTLAAALVLLVANFWYEARRPMLGVITTLPVVLVVLWSFGLMAAFGIPFGPVTATISALAIGIGIPYMIHIAHRFLEDRDRKPGLGAAIESTLSHTGGALAGSALTTVAGFGVLTISTTIPFRQFGFVTAYTILLAMLTAVLVLPSLLMLWARWHRRREAGAAGAAG